MEVHSQFENGKNLGQVTEAMQSSGEEVFEVIEKQKASLQNALLFAEKVKSFSDSIVGVLEETRKDFERFRVQKKK